MGYSNTNISEEDCECLLDLQIVLKQIRNDLRIMYVDRKLTWNTFTQSFICGENFILFLRVSESVNKSQEGCSQLPHTLSHVSMEDIL